MLNPSRYKFYLSCKAQLLKYLSWKLALLYTLPTIFQSPQKEIVFTFCFKLLICHKYLSCLCLYTVIAVHTLFSVLERELDRSSHTKLFIITLPTAQFCTRWIDDYILCKWMAYVVSRLFVTHFCLPLPMPHWRHFMVGNRVSARAGSQETWVPVPALPLTWLPTNHRNSVACTLLIIEMKVLCDMTWQASSSSETHWWVYLSWREDWQSPLFSPCITDIIQNLPQYEYRCGLSVWQRLLSRGNYWVWQLPNPGFSFWDVTITSVVANVSNFSSTYMVEYTVLAVIAWELFFF